MPLILASSSPRRRELLASAGWHFEVMVPDVDETALSGEHPEPHALRVAALKATAVWERAVSGSSKDMVVLAADTIVVRGDRILGKPSDPEDARAMLRLLSGRDHEVVTAVALRSCQQGLDQAASWAVHTTVTFRDLDDAEIEAYLATGEAMDKAGAYGIQGAAAHLVRGIRGSYTNVVGLPLAEVVQALRELGEAP